jgi:cellobiose-specific phosphotransferase system component IIA
MSRLSLSLHSEQLDTIEENAEDEPFQIGTFMMHARRNVVVRITS